jgi:hypothetical protein
MSTSSEIIPCTPIGQVTVRILGFNHPDRLLERRMLQAVNRYPCLSAQLLIGWSV